MTEDPRKTGLKNGLRQLTNQQINRLLDWDGDIMLDEYNYQDGMFCPLAIAIGLPAVIKNPTDEKVKQVLEILGYKIYNTRGIEGSFYTTNRKADLIDAAIEVLHERGYYSV